MNKKNKLIILILIILVFASITLNIFVGSADIKFIDAVKLLFSGSDGSPEYMIIHTIRLPRALLSAILGGALALSGYLLQTYFENPLAGPFVLGISSGAKTFVALYLVFLAARIGFSSSILLVLSSFIGAMLTTFVLILIARKVKNMETLLIAGVMIGYITTAITDLIVSFASDSNIVNLRDWSKGSFSGAKLSDVKICFVMTIILLILSILLVKPIGALRLGESYAFSMGVNVKALRIGVILISSLLSAEVVAYAGPISFVGIAVPCLIRLIMKTDRPSIMIPCSLLLGSAFVGFSDLIARAAFAPVEMNISTVTAIFGAPVVIFMLLRRKH